MKQVRTYRNEIVHTSTMKLEKVRLDTYIDGMIAVLHDGKELKGKQYVQDTVKKLEELKNEAFIITSQRRECQIVLADMKTLKKNIDKGLEDINNSIEGLATKDACEKLERQISTLESIVSKLTEEVKRLGTDNSADKEQCNYENLKKDLQKRLIKLYKKDVLRMSAMPLEQESDLNDFEDVYVRPRMTIAKKDKKEDKKEVDVLSMSDIFTNDDESIKSVYVLGEAGSGKSSFCKSLVNYWCLAHSDKGKSIEDNFNGIKEMKKFEYLFFLPLRYYTDKAKIKEMVKKDYSHPALEMLLECESSTCLIVLDGLDEWAYSSSEGSIKCPAKSDPLKDYTVLTTSRPWKIATLGITDNEIRQKIILKEFDDDDGETSVKNFIEKTVPILNKTFKRDKDPSDCQDALENESLESLKQTAIMLQQLICLWFDERLPEKNSRCALYTEMLDMFFYWNEQKSTVKKPEDLKILELPDYLKKTKVCKSYNYIIYKVSLLAYETLFNNKKETSLSFDCSIFERLKISDEVKSYCLKLGILSEDKCPSLYASRSRESVIAFVHKSFQEYLAAVYIAINFNAHIVSSADSENTDLSDTCSEFFQTFFSKCATLDEILEQANVFIMLCGLEPKIATSISKFIYDIVTKDKRVLEYRRTIVRTHATLILDIQKCIFNCIKETGKPSMFYLGDICIGDNHFEREIISPNIFPDSVISFRSSQGIKSLLKYQRLEAIWIQCNISKADNKSICDAIENNTSTLKSLYVKGAELKMGAIVNRLPDMSHLVALKIKQVRMQHEEITSLCTFLSYSSSQLEQIAITPYTCERNLGRESNTSSEPSLASEPQEVDLSKHHQLQYLKFGNSVTVTRFHTSNLETFACNSLNSTNYVKVFDNLSTANKLTNLCFQYDDSPNKNSSYHTVTDKLVSLLQSLHQLRTLSLCSFTLTDNIIKFPSEMKSMKTILLAFVKMSLTTWRQFVNSLPLIPLPVEVRTLYICITRDGEECNPDVAFMIEGGRGGVEIAAAWQYVRMHEALFNVEDKDITCFSTKSIIQR